jgi:hypothetical protein
MKPGVTLKQAKAEMETIAARLAQQYPKENLRIGTVVNPLHEEVVGDIRPALLLLLATTFLVSPFIGLVPAVAIKVFDAGAGGTSALVTAQGVGAVAAALAAAPLAAGFLLGGIAGPGLVRRLPAERLRVFVALLGLGLAIKLGVDAVR